MSKEQHTNYFKVGWGLIVLAILFFLYSFIKEGRDHDFEGFLSVMANPSQITATFVSIAGLFLVLDNLILQRQTLKQQQVAIEQGKTSIDLQREDMKQQTFEFQTSNKYQSEQNAAFLKQLYETTFFKLLENHSKLIASQTFPTGPGYDGLDKWYKQTTNNVQLYKRYAVTTKIKKLDIATEYPPYVIERNEDIFVLLISSIKHLIKLVVDKLNDDKFYHQTVYNSLSSAEKYFLGYYWYNSINNIHERFKLENFNYLELYESSRFNFAVENGYYFPIVSIKSLNTKFYKEKKFKIINNDFDNSIFDFNFSVFRSKNNQTINLQSIAMSCNRNHSETFFHASTPYEFNDLDGQVLNLTGLVGDTILKDFFSLVAKNIKLNAHTVYEFKLTFNTVYGGKGLGFEKSFNLQCGWYVDSDEVSMSISEKNPHEISIFDK